MAQINNQITGSTQTTIANLYIAILGRNPDAVGFNFWVNRLANNGNTSAAAAEIARGFATSREFIGTYGGQTTTGAVSLMYQNVLNRAPDAGGLAYWVGQVNAAIAAGTPVRDAYALTAAQIITTASKNNTPDTALIVAKQIAAIAAGMTPAPPAPAADTGGGGILPAPAPAPIPAVITGLYNAGAFTIAAPAAVTGAVTVSAAGVIATTDTAATVNQPAGFSQAGLTSFSLAGITATQGTTSNFTAAVSTLLTSITGSASNDNLIFATPALFGRANNIGGATVDGGLGLDTVTFTPQIGVFTVFSNTANQQNIRNIENIVLTAGNTVGLTLDNSVSLANNGSIVNVRNASATADSTVSLGAGAAHTFTSASSGNDVVNLGAAGQQVTISGGGADVVTTSVANSSGSSFTGSAAATETLTFLGGGAINLAATANALTNTMGISGVDRVNLSIGVNVVTVTPGQNMTINAVGGAVTSIAGTGNTITVLQGNAATDVLTLSGTSSYVVNGGSVAGAGTAGAINSTATGTLNVTLGAVTGAQTITSASATTIDAAAFITTGALNLGAGTVGGTYTITNFRGTLDSVALGNTNVTLGDDGVNEITVGNRAANTAVMTVDAAAMQDGSNLVIVGTSNRAIVINNVSDSDVNAGGINNATGNLTINGTAGIAVGGIVQTVNGSNGIDNISIVSASNNNTIFSQTGDLADTINVSGTFTNFLVAGGAGADRITAGTGDVQAGLVNGDTGANNTIGAAVNTTNFDVYTGLNANDQLVITLGAAGTLAVTQSTTLVNGVDNGIVFTRGTYDALLNQFTANGAGNDSLATYDLTVGAGTDFEAVVLVGFTGSGLVVVVDATNTVTLN